VDVPICRHHLLKAWAIVQATMQDLVNTPIEPVPKPQGYVYFVRFRDRIKIGYTTNMISRMDAVPHEEILAVHPGTMRDEKRCHEAFAHLRENGEWFRIEPDLLAFIEDVARKAS
jgi:hypothetical protein